MADVLEQQREQLTQLVARDRATLEDRLLLLGDLMRERFVLGERMAARPGSWIVGGFFIGMWLGMRRHFI